MFDLHRARNVAYLGLVLCVAAGLAACGDAGADAEPVPPAVMDSVPEGEIGRITLTEQAAQRLDITTAPVSEGSQGASLEVPYAAVIYQPDGTTWVYTSPGERVYLREPIEVERIDDDVALLRSGPAVGTPVVTVGASELWGFEFGVGK